MGLVVGERWPEGPEGLLSLRWRPVGNRPPAGAGPGYSTIVTASFSVNRTRVSAGISMFCWPVAAAAPVPAPAPTAAPIAAPLPPPAIPPISAPTPAPPPIAVVLRFLWPA